MKMRVDDFNNKEATADAKQFMRTVELPRPWSAVLVQLWIWMIHIHTPEPFLKCTAEVDLALRTLGHLALCVYTCYVQMICLASFFDTSLFRVLGAVGAQLSSYPSQFMAIFQGPPLCLFLIKILSATANCED